MHGAIEGLNGEGAKALGGMGRPGHSGFNDVVKAHIRAQYTQ